MTRSQGLSSDLRSKHRCGKEHARDMSLKLLKKRQSETAVLPSPGGAGLRSSFHRLLSIATKSWEVALILLAAAFLRFYQINTTELDEDQARLYRMAYDAVHHGLLPITS